MQATPRTIVITGASSGIGTALALEYAAMGVRLGLFGRNETRLRTLQAACIAKGASADIFCVDVTQQAHMEKALQEFDALHPIDLLIANAGISGGSGGGTEGDDQTRRIFSVNVDGVLNSVLPVIPRMTERKKGQIAVMSSLAGMRGLPSAPAYSASKAAVKHYGEALRGSLDKFGISVSVICPGYVKTPLTDKNTFPMPFLMSAEKAAKIIRRGLRWKRARIAFPLSLYLPLWLLSCLSPSLTDWFFSRLPSKGQDKPDTEESPESLARSYHSHYRAA